MRAPEHVTVVRAYLRTISEYLLQRTSSACSHLSSARTQCDQQPRACAEQAHLQNLVKKPPLRARRCPSATARHSLSFTGRILGPYSLFPVAWGVRESD